jgi:hypothetical protein
LYDCDALREGKAMKTLSTELNIVKDLTVGRLLKKGRREGPDASFDIPADVGRAVRMGSPGRRLHGGQKYNTKDSYLNTRF